MLFLFGIKRNLLASTPLEGCTCPNCNQQRLLASKYGSYFHVFFVPFFPTGKSTELECYYCSKKYDGKFVPADISAAMHRNPVFMQKKRPLWHSLGCLGVLLLIMIIVVIGISSIVYHAITPSKPKELTRYELAYKEDLKKLTSTPDCRIDSISCSVKTYLDSVVPYAINLNKVAYYSQVKAPYTKSSKVLILLRIDDLDAIEVDRRNMIVSYVLDAMEAMQYDKDKLYICLRRGATPVIVYTPEGNHLDGYDADDNYLPNFYMQY